MSGPWTRVERLQSFILLELEEDGPTTGWILWLDYAKENELDTTQFAGFKSALSALEREGHVVKTGVFRYPKDKKKLKHWGTAEWMITEAGQKRQDGLIDKIREWHERREAEDEVADWKAWVDTDITIDRHPSPEVWKALGLQVVRAGTLMVRFSMVSEEEPEDLL